MRLRTPLLTLVALAVCAGARAQQQEQQTDRQVIDDFVTTRGMSFTSPSKQTQKQAAPAPASRRRNPATGRRPSAGSDGGGVASGKTPGGKGASSSKQNAGGAGVTAQSDGAAPPNGAGAGVSGAKTVQAGARTLGLGFTMYRVGEEGRLSYVDPSEEFKTGDRIAIAFETNADGYLYLFNQSGGAQTLDMVFPDVGIDGGANAIQANTYTTFPSEVRQGFEFTPPAAAEHLFIVFSRRPLADVPAGEALVKFCGGKKSADCTWALSAAQWARIRDGAKGRRVREAKNTDLLAQGAPPPDFSATLQRGLKVSTSAPAPAFVRVNDSPTADVLISEIVLTHK